MNHAICSDIIGQYHLLGQSFQTPDNKFSLDLTDVVIATRFRRMSVVSDEPLCLGTVLNLDNDNISKVQIDMPPRREDVFTENTSVALRDKRMEVVWQSMSGTCGGIPLKIIFAELDRLNSVGFRWAPSSFQQSPLNLIRTSIMATDYPGSRASLSKVGLSVRFPAWRIRVKNLPEGMPPDIRSRSEIAANTSYLLNPRGKWLWLDQMPTTSADENESTHPNCAQKQYLANSAITLILILERTQSFVETKWSTAGLVASLETNTEGCKVVRSLKTVDLTDLNSNKSTLLQWAYCRAMELRKVCSGQQGELRDVPHKITEMSKAALEDARLAEILINASLEEPVKLVEHRIWSMFLGEFFVVEESFDPETEWTVD